MSDFILFLISKNYIICVIYLILTNICLTQLKQFHCPDSNKTKFNVTDNYDVSVKIECANIDYDEFKILLTCNISLNRNVKLLKIRNCPLPNDGSSINIIPQQLGIKSYEKLVVENNNLITNLTKYHLRDLYGLKSLSLRCKNFLYKPLDLFADKSLRNLTQLDFHTSMEELPSTIFENLENLATLTIGHNITKLPNGVFRKLLKLKELNLFNNRLQNITKAMFGHGSAIKTINLQHNNIETLPSDVFELFTDLTIVEFKLMQIQTLPETIFKNNVKLSKFILTNNRADCINLPQMLLANLPALIEVLITCNLNNVSENVFYNSKNIEKIIMSGNKLQTLPFQLFGSQINLIELNLSRNQLEEIPRKLFQNTTKLNFLRLANNNLKTIRNHLFVRLKHLKLLDLSNNQLSTIGFIANFITNDLGSLLLRNNSISAMDTIHHLPKNLGILDFSYNNISELLGKHLEKFDTSNLALNLTYNQIQTINMDDFGRNYLPEILHISMDLNHNPLKCDCHLMGFIDYLKNSNKENINHLLISKHLKINTINLKCSTPLHLNETLVKRLDPYHLLCPFEEEYGNSKDCPENCTCSIRPSDKTLIVNCSNGTWTNIPKLPQIEKHNLTHIELNMENNRLTELNLSEARGLVKVTKLLLAGNLLKTLNVNTLEFWNQSQTLKTISLLNNPLLCECDKTKLSLYEFIHIQNTKYIDSANITCSHNSGVKYLHQLRDLCQIDSTIYITLAGIITTIMLVIALFYKYQRVIKILLYAHNGCRWFVADYELDEDKLYDAYVSYAQKDEEFIVKNLIPKLENGAVPFKLCIPDRDWLVGECIADKIAQSIEDSKRTIVVLSKNYIQSEWSNMEFQAAHRAKLNEGRKKLIIIKYNDIGEIENLDSDLKIYLRLKLYLQWGDTLFWKKLCFEMPHTQQR